MIGLPDIPLTITPDLVLRELWADFKIPATSAKKRWGKKITELIQKSQEWISPSGVYEIFDCLVQEDQLILDEGKGIFTSSSLVKTIGESSRVGLFIATIGDELEQNMKSCSRSDAIILEAVGSAAAEECAEYMHHRIIDPLIKEDEWQKTVRLSPGWGLHKRKQNWDLSGQKIIFDLLNPGKKSVDVILTSDYLMLPRKSVSAIVGVKRSREIRE